MPECERCGDTHATVNEATWVNQTVRLCPVCWSDATDGPPPTEPGWDRFVHEAENLFTKASMRWGGDAQMAKAAEEFSELAAECARDLNRQADQEEFLEEVVDARIMLEQLTQWIRDDMLEDAVEDALDDLEARIEGGDDVE